MVSSPILSIVVPIFNVESHLERCLRSLRALEGAECEFILIDDGSTDSSGAIAEDFAERDDRATVIHQDNRGLGPARNAGMRRCRGKYVAFVDSDDWLDDGAYAEMLQLMETHECDVCFGGYKIVSNGRTNRVVSHPLAGRILNSPEDIAGVRATFYAAPGLIKGEQYLPITAWCALYRRDFIESHNVEFHNIFSEDVVFNIETVSYANCVSFASSTFYNYRKDNQPSITRSANKDLWTRNEAPIAAARETGARDGYISEDELALRITANTLTRVISTVKSAVSNGSGISFFLSIIRSIRESSSFHKGMLVLRDEAQSSRLSIGAKSRFTLGLISSGNPVALRVLYFLMRIIG